MIKKPKFFITSVFGEGIYTGNPLATFLNCERFSDIDMQKIAREINFSETTFVLSNEPKNGAWDVRIFTPAEEVDFAGHPTLGTAFIIQKHIINQAVREVILNLKVGQVAVAFPSEKKPENVLWMRQVNPVFGDKLKADSIARVLGLDSGDIDTRWPVQQISTGIPFIVVPLKSLDALKRAAVSKEHYQKLINESWAKAILVFSPKGYNKNHDLGVRVFVDYYGIPEDPATGSGNGCLAAYLVRNRYFQSDVIDVRVGQGYEIGRPSLLYLRASEQEGQFDIDVGGQVASVAEGLWG